MSWFSKREERDLIETRERLSRVIGKGQYRNLSAIAALAAGRYGEQFMTKSLSTPNRYQRFATRKISALIGCYWDEAKWQ